jgi:hypothetical protein
VTPWLAAVGVAAARVAVEAECEAPAVAGIVELAAD